MTKSDLLKKIGEWIDEPEAFGRIELIKDKANNIKRVTIHREVAVLLDDNTLAK